MVEDSPLISIVVPVYNVEDYVEKCIRSIMRQTYPLLEIIIVDDGSDDDSGSICDRLEAEDARIKVIHQNNQGLVRARKKGLEVSKGELIGFVDGDDYIEPHMYERLYRLLTEHDADFVHSGYFMNDTGHVKGVQKEGVIRVTAKNRVLLLQKILLGYDENVIVSPSIWSKLFKRDLVIQSYKAIEDSSSYGEDLLCLCSCFMKDIQFYVVAEAYYHYNIRDKSLSNDEDVAIMVKLGTLYGDLRDMFIQYGLWDCLKKSVDGYYVNGIIGKLSQRGKGSLNKCIQVYQFPSIELLFGQRVILYGAGSVGCDYFTQIRKYMKCELIAWADARYAEYQCGYCELIDPTTIPDLEYDVVLIGVIHRSSAEEIKRSLVQLGVSEEKIWWKYPEKIWISSREY